MIQLGYTNPNTMGGSCLQLASSDLVASQYGFVDHEWPGQYLAGRAAPDLR